MDLMVSKETFYDALRVLGTNFDLWPPHGLPIVEDQVENLISYWCPVNPDPPSGVVTVFQLIAPIGPGWIQAAFDEQGARPHKYHNTNFRVPDLNVLLEHLARQKIPHRVEDSFSVFKGRRLFIGRSRDDPNAYDGGYDLNMRLEMVDRGFRIQAYGSRSDKDRWRPDYPPPPWGYVKLASRTVVVEDVFEAISTLGRNFFLWPRSDSAVINLKRDRVKRIAIPSEPTGSDTFIELLEARDESSRYGTWLKQWGVGPWGLTFQVHDLTARLKLFDERCVRYELMGPDDQTPYSRAFVDPNDSWGANFVYVDFKT
jgi:hypothetical protein